MMSALIYIANLLLIVSGSHKAHEIPSSLEYTMNNIEMNVEVNLFETEEFWVDDSLYCFLNISLDIDRDKRLAFTGERGIMSNTHVINRLWVQREGCKISALKVYEENLGEKIRLRGLFLVDDFRGVEGNLTVYLETMINHGNNAVSETRRNSYQVDYVPNKVTVCNSDIPRANLENYRRLLHEDISAENMTTRCE